MSLQAKRSNLPQTLCLIAVFIFASGCAPYFEQSRPALDAYRRGNFFEASELADSIHPRKADRLVAWLDKATIYHSAKKYDKSIKFFAKAEELAEQLKGTNVAAEAGAVFANDNVLSYSAGPYQRLLIHAYQIMNYAALQKFDEAQVEVRRIDTVFTDNKSPFVNYLSGLIWGENRLCNDAYIDFKRVEKLKLHPAGLKDDIKNAYECSGLGGGKPDAAPNVIIVMETGMAPVKESTEYKNALQIIPVPVYEDQKSAVTSVTASVDGGSEEKVPYIEDVPAGLKEELENEMPGIIARALARLAVKETAAVAVGEKVDKDFGILLGIMALATNRADLRSWRTLPRDFRVWRGHLKTGRHTIRLEFLDDYGKSVRRENVGVDVKAGESNLITIRSVE